MATRRPVLALALRQLQGRPLPSQSRAGGFSLGHSRPAPPFTSPFSSSSSSAAAPRPASWLEKLKGFFVSPEREAADVRQPVADRQPVLGSDAAALSKQQFNLEKFADELQKARAFGKLTQYGRGLPRGGEETAARSLQRQEDILRKLAAYSPDGQRLETTQKREVAKQCGCLLRDVDNVLGKYEWAREANARMMQLKAEGKPLPKSLNEVEEIMGGKWKSAASVSLAKDGPPSRNSLCFCGSGKKYKRCVASHPPYPWRPFRAT